MGVPVSGFTTTTTCIIPYSSSRRSVLANNNNNNNNNNVQSISRLQVSISPGPAQDINSNNDQSSPLFSSTTSTSSVTTTQQQQQSSAKEEEDSRNSPQDQVDQAAVVVNWDWKAVMDEIWKLDKRPIILFDGECNLCNGGVNMLLDMDTNNVFRFCSLSSKFGKSLLVAHGKDPNDRDNIIMVSPVIEENEEEKTVAIKTSNNPDDDEAADVVVVEEEEEDVVQDITVVQSKYLQKSEAVMAIATQLDGAPKWVKAMTKVAGTVVAPPELMDWLLNIIAQNRHRVNIINSEEYDQCRLDFDFEYDGRFLNDDDHPHLFLKKKKERTS